MTTTPSLSTAPKPYTSYRWAREDYSRYGRLIDIWRFVLTFLFYSWLDQKTWSYRGDASRDRRLRRQRARAIWVRETLLNLGPTFIKVGQFFSTRADLFPSEYVEELSKLQDRVPSFGYERVAEIVESELGKPISTIFSYFEATPIAAASLGQVHRAQLKSGEEVVVKAQRPGLTRLFSIDLEILKGIAYYLQHHTSLGGRGSDWPGIYEECRRTLWEEVNYLNEGRNADTFRRNFRDVPEIAVPRVYWRYTSQRLLTLEYLPGIKISDADALVAAKLNPKSIARLGAYSYLRQLLKDGFFHADPHPGNIAVRPDNGTLVFYDFGMMGRISHDVKQKLMVTLSGIATKDADLIVSSLTDLGALVPTADMTPVRRSIQYMLDNFMDRPFTSDEVSITAISDDLYQMAYDQPFRFPATFTFVMRAMTTLEGLGKGLDPDFDFLAVAQPFADEFLVGSSQSMGETLLTQVGRQAAEFTNTSLTLPRRIESTLTRVEQGDLRLRVRSTEAERLIRKLNSIGMGAIYALLFGSFLLTATNLFVAGHATLTVIALCLAAVAGGALIRVVLRLERSERTM